MAILSYASHHSDVFLGANFEFMKVFPFELRTKNVRYFKCSNKTAVFDLSFSYHISLTIFKISSFAKVNINMVKMLF